MLSSEVQPVFRAATRSPVDPSSTNLRRDFPAAFVVPCENHHYPEVRLDLLYTGTPFVLQIRARLPFPNLYLSFPMNLHGDPSSSSSATQRHPLPHPAPTLCSCVAVGV